MSKPLRTLIRHTLYRGKANLQSLDTPYQAMRDLLAGHHVQGVIDAGASDGRFARRLLELYPHATVYGFEPHPDYADTLNRFASENPRFRPQPVALAEQTGTITLNLTADIGQTSLFAPGAGGAAITRKVDVPVVRLDDWWRQQGQPPVDVVKFDIQGAEADAIRGGRELIGGPVRLVYTEVFFNPVYAGGALFSDIDLALRDCGLSLYSYYKVVSDDAGRLKWANAIYTR